MNLYSNEYPSIYRGVVESNEDPLNIGRCKVRVPSINSEDGEIPWARPIVGSPVNQTRGSVNIPEEGDIVWVMYENSNKRYPLYFGGTYAKDDIEVNTNLVDIYVENENKITYDREAQSYTINIGGSSVTIQEDSISISGDTSISGDLSVSGNLSVEGELTVSENATFKKDIHVEGTTYTRDIVTLGMSTMFSDLPLAGLTQEEMDALLDSLGIDGMTDFLYIASKFMGFNEADGTADIFTHDIGFGSSSTTPWCAAFVSYCLKAAGVTGLRSASVSGLMSQAKNLGLFKEKGSYIPKPGDIFIEKSNGASHTGFVVSVDPVNGTYTTVEGNSGDRVTSNTKRFSSGILTGFIQMNKSSS